MPDIKTFEEMYGEPVHNEELSMAISLKRIADALEKLLEIERTLATPIYNVTVDPKVIDPDPTDFGGYSRSK